jgi:hypothetical protein
MIFFLGSGILAIASLPGLTDVMHTHYKHAIPFLLCWPTETWLLPRSSLSPVCGCLCALRYSLSSASLACAREQSTKKETDEHICWRIRERASGLGPLQLTHPSRPLLRQTLRRARTAKLFFFCFNSLLPSRPLVPPCAAAQAAAWRLLKIAMQADCKETVGGQCDSFSPSAF